MTDDTASPSFLSRLKQFLNTEPQTLDQLITVLRDAHARALIDAETLRMVEGVIQFSQLRVRDIMLPKQQMTCVSEHASLEEVLERVANSGHSRFPVTGDTCDEVIGILHAKDLLRCNLQPASCFDLQDMVRPAVFIPESKRLDLLLSEFRNNRNHMALVVDEYGNINGFVTIEDIIEQIVGDIEDEFDIDEEAYIKTHGEGHYIIKGNTPVEVFNTHLKTGFSDETYDTMGGLVMARFGYLPKRGDTINMESMVFRVINADARRIKLLDCFDKRETGAL